MSAVESVQLRNIEVPPKASDRGSNCCLRAFCVLSLRPEISAPHWQGRWKCRGGTRSPAQAESLPHVAALLFNSIRPPSLRSSTNHPPCAQFRRAPARRIRSRRCSEAGGLWKAGPVGAKDYRTASWLIESRTDAAATLAVPATLNQMRRDPSQEWTCSGSLDNKP